MRCLHFSVTEEFITPSGVTSRYYFNNTKGVDKPPYFMNYIDRFYNIYILDSFTDTR